MHGTLWVKNPVVGTAQVVSCSQNRERGSSAMVANCHMQLVVTVEGRDPYPAKLRQMVPPKRWPQPGLTVPVIVSRDDPTKLKIDFDQVPTTSERAAAIAAQQAAMMVGQTEAVRPASTGSPTVEFVGDLTPDQISVIEQATGMDIDGDGFVGSAAATPPGAPNPAGDRLEQLERLARLRESGMLTDAEFEAEKRRLLG